MGVEDIVVASLMQELNRLGLSALPTGSRDVDIRVYTERGLVGVIECKAASTASTGWQNVYGAIGQVMYFGRALVPGLPLGICFHPMWAGGIDDGTPFVISGSAHEEVRLRLTALGIYLIFAWALPDGTVRSHGLEQYADRVREYDAAPGQT
jgi:hypothetical protein